MIRLQSADERYRVRTGDLRLLFSVGTVLRLPMSRPSSPGLLIIENLCGAWLLGKLQRNAHRRANGRGGTFAKILCRKTHFPPLAAFVHWIVRGSVELALFKGIPGRKGLIPVKTRVSSGF